MRLVLDAHFSTARVASPLRTRGHDVRAVDEERGLVGAADEDLLEIATEDGRILVTADVGDFARIVGEWARSGRAHAGCMVLVGLDHSEFSTIVELVERMLSAQPDTAAWTGLTTFVGREGVS